MNRRRAFTLVELLVVVGIIAVLIGIIFPSLRRVQQQAKRTQCMTQMSQIGVALSMYVAENKGRTPVQIADWVPDCLNPASYDRAADPVGQTHLAYRNMFGALVQYLNGQEAVFQCPVALDFTWSGTSPPTAESDVSFMGNAVVSDRRLTKIRRASEIVFLQENRFRWGCAWLRPRRSNTTSPAVYTSWCWDNPGLDAAGRRWGQEYTSVHEGGGNLVFVDGHAEYRKHADLRARDFGLTGGAGVGGTPNDPSTTPHGQTYYAEFN